MTESPATFELEVPPDPAVAVTVRAFVRSSATLVDLSDEDIETLALVATELLANAIETAQPLLRLEIEAGDGHWTLRADGVGPLGTASDGLVDRQGLLFALAAVSIDPSGRVELSSNVPA
jgi:hypothetical protein